MPLQPDHATLDGAGNKSSGNALVQPYYQVLTAIQAHQHIFFSPETSPHPPLNAQSNQSANYCQDLPTIASLSLHPALESALHIMNADLASAHFLLRHAESPPALECMYLHGILHRIEGDIDNARAWYSNVQGSEILNSVWQLSTGKENEGAISSWKGFLDRVEAWRDRTKRRQRQAGLNANHQETQDWAREEEELRCISQDELNKVLRFCETKFGVDQFEHAEDVWVQSHGRLKEKKKNMLVGGEGWREF